MEPPGDPAARHTAILQLALAHGLIGLEAVADGRLGGVTDGDLLARFVAAGELTDDVVHALGTLADELHRRGRATGLPAAATPSPEELSAAETRAPVGRAPTSGVQVGDQLGPYVLMQILGRGGMGLVFRARRTDLQRDYALKIILPGSDASPEMIERFRREAKAAAGLSGHPGIVGVHDIGEDAGRVFFAMDLVVGKALDQVIDAGTLPPVEAARMLAEAARAVHYAHEQRILHRDLKPANLMVDERGSVLVTDFGLAASQAADQQSAKLTQSGIVLGTPAYMPPEQARGETLDARADVYALGATLYECLVAEPPFQGDSIFEVLAKSIREEPKSPRKRDPRVPRDLETIVMKCLEKDRDRRYPSAEALAVDLERFVAGEAISARPASLAYRIRKRVRRHPAAFAVGAAAAALAVAYAAGPAWVEVTVPGGAETRFVWPAGKHTLTFARTGFLPQQATVQALPWATVPWKPPLRLDHGFVTVSSDPPGGRYTITIAQVPPRTGTADGSRVTLPLGSHQLRVEADGHDPYVAELAIASGVTVRVDATLKREQGNLTVTSAVDEARVGGPTIDGELPLPLRARRMDAGLTELVVRARNHFAWRTRVKIPHWHGAEPQLAADDVRPWRRFPGFAHVHASPQPMRRWGTTLGASLTCAPTLADVDLDGAPDAIVATDDGRVLALRAELVEVLWEATIPGAALGGVAMADVNQDGRPDAVLGLDTGRVVAISGRDGQPIWSVEVGGKVWAAPVLTDCTGDRVPDAVVGWDGGALAALDGRTGRLIWRAAIGAIGFATPVVVHVDDDGVADVVVQSEDGVVHAISGRDGLPRWTQRGLTHGNAPLAVGDCDGQDGDEVVVVSRDGVIWVMRPADGTRLWERDLKAPASSGAMLDDRDGNGSMDCLVVTDDGGVHALAGPTGAEVWTARVQGQPSGAARAVDADRDGARDVVIATDQGHLRVLSGATGTELWRFEVEDAALQRPSSVADVDGDGYTECLVATADGRLLSVRLEPPAVEWAQELDGPVRHRPAWRDLDGDGRPEVVLGTDEPTVHALALSDGAPVWRTTAGTLRAAPSFADLDGDDVPDVLVGGTDRRATAISGATAKTLWRVDAGDDVRVRIPFGDWGDDGRLPVVGTVAGQVRVLERDGSNRWSVPLPSAVRTAPQVVRLDGAAAPDVIVGTDDGTVFALSGIDGGERWRHAAGGAVRAPMLVAPLDDDDAADVIVATRTGRIVAISGADGAPIWSRIVAGARFSAATWIGDLDGDTLPDVVLGRMDGRILAIGSRTGRTHWASRPGRTDEVEVLAVGDPDGDGTPELLVGSESDRTEVLDPASGAWLAGYDRGGQCAVVGDRIVTASEYGWTVVGLRYTTQRRPPLAQAFLGSWHGLLAHIERDLDGTPGGVRGSVDGLGGALATDRRVLQWIRGRALLRTGRFDDATRSLQRAIDQGLRSAEVYADLLRAAAGRGELRNETLNDLPWGTATRLLVAEGGLADLVRFRARSLLENAPPTAIAVHQLAGNWSHVLGATEGVAATDWRRLHDRALALAMSGNLGDASAALGRSLQANPYSPESIVLQRWIEANSKTK